MANERGAPGGRRIPVHRNSGEGMSVVSIRTPKADSGQGRRSALKDGCILVVGGTKDTRTAVANAFSECGAKVTVADAKADAMLFVGSSKFDLIILDLVTPDPKGCAVLEFMREVRRDLLERTIVLKAHRHDESDLTDARGGRVACLFQPIGAAELRNVARAVFSSAGPAGAG